MLLEAKEPKKALEYFENASKLQPDFEEPLYGQIESLLDMGQMEKARKVVPKVIEVTTRKRTPDGKAWIYKAMLEAQANPVEAAGSLFKSLSLGYFGDNTVSLICSLLNQLDKAGLDASQDKQDFKSLIDKVFTPENLDNIRKGVTYGDDVFFPADEASFNATPAGNLEANRSNNARIASDYENRSSAHWDKAEKATQKSPAISLLYAMEAAYLPVNVSGLEGSYEKLTRALGMEYGEDAFYLPDARAFWCLRLLERYYKYCLDYAGGAFGYFDDKTRTFHGYLPEGYKTNILNHVNRTDKDTTLLRAMNKRHQDTALKLHKKCTAEFDKWLEDHPGASDSAIERAERRIFRPYRTMTEVTHPLEQLDQIDVVSETEKVNSDMVYYNNTVRPILADWWKDVSKYCSYCCDGNVSTYFWYRTLALIYNEYGATFASKATVGESLYQFRLQILKKEAEIKEEQWQDHIEAIAEHEQAEKDARDIAELQGRQWHGLSDLFISMQTPLGSIDFGLKEGKFGIHLDVKDSYVNPEPLDARKVEASVLTDPNVLGYMQNVLLSAAGGMNLGDLNTGNAALAMRALTGKLIDQKDETKYNMHRDSGGNMQIQRTDSRTYDIAGYGSVLTEQRQVGRIAARRDVVTYGFGGFFSISGGSTSFKH